MKKKRVKNYEYLGLGFPILFSSVELFFAQNEWLPKVNMNKLMAAAFEALLESPAKYTGAQIIFIRGYMGMTQETLALSLGLTSHVQISRWEKTSLRMASLSSIHEANLRVLMRSFLGRKTLSVDDHVRVLSGGLINATGPIRLKAA